MSGMPNGINDDVQPGDPAVLFGKSADTYDRMRPPYPDAVVDDIIRNTGIQPGEHIIADIGAGNGLLGLAFARKGFDVRLVEPSADMLRVARRHIEEEGLQERVTIVPGAGLSTDTGLPAQSVDLVVAGNATHWFILDKDAKNISDENALATSTEFSRILKPGGKVALVNFAPALHDPVIGALHAHLSQEGAGGVEAYRKYSRMFYDPAPDKTESYPGFLLQEGEGRFSSGGDAPVPSTLARVMDYLVASRTLRLALDDKPGLIDEWAAQISSHWHGEPDKEIPVTWHYNVDIGLPRAREVAMGSAEALIGTRSGGTGVA
jgi:ubiquinone/menaquinone biosynthesis C-methylase UbiE